MDKVDRRVTALEQTHNAWTPLTRKRQAERERRRATLETTRNLSDITLGTDADDEEEGDEALPTSPTTKTSRDARRAPLRHLPSFPSPSPASHDGREPLATPHRGPQTA